MVFVLSFNKNVGEFEGASAANVCGDLSKKIQNSFTKREFKSEIFVVGGGACALGAQKT